MSFSANIEKTKLEAITLVRLRPRQRFTNWITIGGEPDIYYSVWSGVAHAVYVDSATQALVEAESLAECKATANSFYSGPEGGVAINLPGKDPAEAFVVIEWNVHLASRDLRWFKNPMDSSSGDKYWQGGIIEAPAPRQGNQSLIFGYSPVNTTTLSIQVADGTLFEHLHDWSLWGASIKVWLCVGELAIENISELFVGLGGDIRMNDGRLEIDVHDPLRVLDGQWQGDYFSVDSFPTIDPDAVGTPIREIYGFLPTFLPVNIDFNGTPTVNNNRDWVVCKGTLADSGAIENEILWTGLGNGPTYTKVVNPEFFNIGDSIIIHENSTDKYARVSGVDVDTGYLTHTNIGSRMSGTGDVVKRGFCASVSIRVTAEGKRPEFYYLLNYGQDYTEAEFADGTIGIVLADDFEGSGSFPFPETSGVFDPQFCQLRVAVYGKKVLPKKLDGVTDFGARSSYGGVVGNPVVVLWDILTTKVSGFKELIPLDEDAWEALALSFDRTIGLAIPAVQGDDFPTWKELAQKLFQTELLRMHFKIESGLSVLTITQTSPSTAGGREISARNFAEAFFDWDFQDIYSKVVVHLNRGELDSQEIVVDKNSTYFHQDAYVEPSPLRAAAYLHRSEKVFHFDVLYTNADASIIAWRLARLLGERRGTIELRLPRGFLEETIDNSASVQLKRLTGFPVTDETRTRDYKITQHQKSANGVTLILDDQKGIQDSGRWV